jgi:predicted ATPase
MEEANRWLSGESLLRTGYRLERVESKEVQVPGVFHQMFERGVNDDDIGDLQELYQSLPVRSEIALRDFQKGILVAPGDVGVGISQMVPVVVAALRKRQGVLAIEQPELHIHPAIQVAMGDLFIRAIQADPDGLPVADKTLLIETHSEHILLRLLRRIRERTEKELPPGVAGLAAENLSIIYVEGNGQGVRFRPLRVDAEGEFRDQWPNGFFEERAGELF